MTKSHGDDPLPGKAARVSNGAMIARRRTLLGPAYRLFYTEPLHVVRGEGVWLYDSEGSAYLDVYNNVASVGHCHPHVVAALSRQAAELNTHTRYLHKGVLAYAERLLGYFPPQLGHVMFTCTGSEANDLALRLARAHTGGTGVIVTDFAYHGNSVATVELSPSLGSNLAAHVRTIPPPDALRCRGGNVAEEFSRHIRAAVADLAAQGIKPAALIADTVFSSDGVFTDPAGFLEPAVEAIRDAGGVFIADEVQAGFGRTGRMWGFERHRVVPDLVTLGKPMGNGHPVAGVVLRPAIAESFGRVSRYFNTFGGNPVSCAVGMAVLDVIEQEGLREKAEKIGRKLREGLLKLARRHPMIAEIRGSGLFVGVELVQDSAMRAPATKEAAAVVDALRKRRVLISATGRAGNVLKIRPPLVFSVEHADLFLSELDHALGEVLHAGGGSTSTSP